MNKEELLAQVRSGMETGLLTKEDVFGALGGTPVQATPIMPSLSSSAGLAKHIGIAEVLYFIGGAIVFLGIAVLVGQNWMDLPVAARVLVTLGSGLAAYVVGTLLGKEDRFLAISSAFFLISGLLVPFGLGVVFDAAGWDAGGSGVQALIAFLSLAMYFTSYLLMRQSIFIIFSVAYGTAFFFAFTDYFMGGSPYLYSWHFNEYRVLIVGITYLLLGYYYSQTERRGLVGPLYSFGTIAFLGAGIALGGFSPNQNVFWELIFPALVFGIIFLSVYLRSKALLTFGSLYLMGYILKITGEYFSKNMGWAFALVVAGLGLMAVGYLSVYLNRKYLRAPAAQ
ncbi:MAG: hypothetical protein AAB759_02475 [Patescibacteria group bacterium]